MTARIVLALALAGLLTGPVSPSRAARPEEACVTSRGRWQATPFATQEGTFSVEFDIVARRAPINAITGLSLGHANAYTDLAAAVRFSPEGVIDARNGSDFAARVSLSYEAGARYHVRMIVRMREHRYDVFVTPPGGTEQTLALGYRFRSEQDDVDALNHVAVFARDGSHEVCALSVPESEVAAAPGVEETPPLAPPPSKIPAPPAREPVRGESAVLVGAGDIGNCGTETDQATAKLLDRIEGTVFTVGDNAYPDGSSQNFARCFDPTWGRHRDRMRPTPGNHDYNTPGARGYFDYFGARAGPAGLGYYSYDLGAWHIIALNSNISVGDDSPQGRWLRQDLAASSATCTLAYWHEPRFSSGSHGNSTKTQALWDALYQAGADVVLGGHDHNYERFAPQTPDGRADPQRGIRQFIVGTGGTRLRAMESRAANSEARNGTTHGLLKLVLHPDRYDWEFVPVAGESFTDRGSARCH